MISRRACLPKPKRSSRLRLPGRTDLRNTPLVTIDPIDARDHDDAVYAEAGHGSAQQRRAYRHRRHRRRRPLRAGRDATRQGSAVARELGLFSRPRRADAAGEDLERSLLAARRRGPALPRGAHDLRSAGPQAQPYVPARHDALGRQAQLPGGAGGHRRAPERQSQAAHGARAQTAVGRLRLSLAAPAMHADRSTSICPSARSSSTRRAASPASSFRSASPRIGSSRSS